MSQSNDELDRAIDDVAREMMRADASADLRARVAARLSGARADRAAPFARWAWGSACAAVAMAAIAVLLFRPSARPSQPATSPVQTAATNAATAPIIDRGAEPSPDGQSVVSTRPPRRRIQRAVDANPGLAWEVGPEPLPRPDPIAIDTLAPPALAVPGFDVAPLNDIQPITIPAAGPGLPEPQRRESR